MILYKNIALNLVNDGNTMFDGKI